MSSPTSSCSSLSPYLSHLSPSTHILCSSLSGEFRHILRRDICLSRCHAPYTSSCLCGAVALSPSGWSGQSLTYVVSGSLSFLTPVLPVRFPPSTLVGPTVPVCIPHLSHWIPTQTNQGSSSRSQQKVCVTFLAKKKVVRQLFQGIGLIYITCLLNVLPCYEYFFISHLTMYPLVFKACSMTLKWVLHFFVARSSINTLKCSVALNSIFNGILVGSISLPMLVARSYLSISDNDMVLFDIPIVVLSCMSLFSAVLRSIALMIDPEAVIFFMRLWNDICSPYVVRYDDISTLPSSFFGNMPWSVNALIPCSLSSSRLLSWGLRPALKPCFKQLIWSLYCLTSSGFA